MTEPKPLKKKKCKACKETFQPDRQLQVTCGYKCAIDWMKILKEKKEKREAKERRSEHRKAKNEFALNDKKTQRNLAQKWFNRFVRLRDRSEPCISCQRYHQGQVDAGHYRTTAAAPQLRFDEENVHAQCSPCNRHKSGNIGEYRINLLKKIGEEAVARLEGSHEPKKYTAQDFVEIKERYMEKCHAIEKDL